MCRQSWSHHRCSPVIVHTLILTDDVLIACCSDWIRQNTSPRWLFGSPIIARGLVQAQIPLLLISTFRETHSTLGITNQKICWVLCRETEHRKGSSRSMTPVAKHKLQCSRFLFQEDPQNTLPHDPSKESISYWISRFVWLLKISFSVSKAM